MAEWLRGLTRKPKVRTAVSSNPALDDLVLVCNSSLGRPEPCEGNLVAAAVSLGGLMVKHPWPLLEISLSDFCRLATLNVNTYLPTWGVHNLGIDGVYGPVCRKLPPCKFQNLPLCVPTFSLNLGRKLLLINNFLPISAK